MTLNEKDLENVELNKGRWDSFMLLGTYNETFCGMEGFYQEFFYDYDYAVEKTKEFIKHGMFTQVIKHNGGWLMWVSHQPFWLMDDRFQSSA